jgi:transcriptional regulator with XRE-family HTH domain
MKRPTSRTVTRSAEQIGESLLTWRKLHRLTAEQVAQRANINRSTLRKLEHGDPSVSLETFLSVLRALGLTNDLVQALDPFQSDLGIALSGQRLPERVRN